MNRFHCLSCDELRTIEIEHGVFAQGHNEYCLGGTVIPIATLCSEPTVIDESDLAPGMVAVFEPHGHGFYYVVQMCVVTPTKGGFDLGRTTGGISVGAVKWAVSGKVPPC